MALYPFQGDAYNVETDDLVENATGGQAYETSTSTTPLPLFSMGAEVPMAELTANDSGRVYFKLEDRLECWVEFPGQPRTFVQSMAVPGLLAAAIAAPADAEAARLAAEDARDAALAVQTGAAGVSLDTDPDGVPVLVIGA